MKAKKAPGVAGGHIEDFERTGGWPPLRLSPGRMPGQKIEEKSGNFHDLLPIQSEDFTASILFGLQPQAQWHLRAILRQSSKEC